MSVFYPLRIARASIRPPHQQLNPDSGFLVEYGCRYGWKAISKFVYFVVKMRSRMEGSVSFEWDERKNEINKRKHGLPFEQAQYAFADPRRVIARDIGHSRDEERFYCFGIVGGDIVTVRFTYRSERIRIIGAGYWRKGKEIYEKENEIR